MPKCNSCNGSVLRTDAFCGTCGEPVPGGKPVVPIARESKPLERDADHERSREWDVRAIDEHGDSRPALRHRRGRLRWLHSPTRSPSRVGRRRPQPHCDSRAGATQRTGSGATAPSEEKRHRRASAAKNAASARDSQAGEPRGLRPGAGHRACRTLPIPPGPPILASDLLREQMRPSSPGEKALRRTAVALTAVGVLGALLTGGVHPLTFVALGTLDHDGDLGPHADVVPRARDCACSWSARSQPASPSGSKHSQGVAP